MARIDHVVVAVRDLPAAAATLLDRYGLEAQPGREHVGAGTANMVVPVGQDQYLELLTVTDPTSSHPVPKFLTPLLVDGDRLLHVAVQPDDLDATAERLGEPVFSLAGATYDGHQIRWRLTGTVGMLSPAVMPFFVVTDDGRQWCSGSRPPRHLVEPDGVRWVEVGGDAETIRSRLDDDSLPIKITNSRPGVVALAVALADGGEIELRF